MICEQCHGGRYATQIQMVNNYPVLITTLCPSCNGTSISYCCEATGLNCDVTNQGEVDGGSANRHTGLHGIEGQDPPSQ